MLSCEDVFTYHNHCAASTKLLPFSASLFLRTSITAWPSGHITTLSSGQESPQHLVRLLGKLLSS